MERRDFEEALESAWNEMKAWGRDGKFKPRNEEDVQCFLYYSLVTRLGTASDVHAKSTCSATAGKREFPDLVLGQDDVVAEIKVTRPQDTRGAVYRGCKKDIDKMRRHHPQATRYFLLYEIGADSCCLDEHQKTELGRIDPDGRFLLHPEILTANPRKAIARKAINTLIQKRYDFRHRRMPDAGRATRRPGKAPRSQET